MNALRRLRREFWLWIASVGLERALLTCEMPEDEATMVRISESAQVLLS